MPSHLWSLVLAGGGDGRDPSPRRARDGAVVPRQYCRGFGARSLLERTLDRADRIGSRATTVTAVDRRDVRWWSAQLMDRAWERIVIQDTEPGTVTSVLLPILHILRQDRDAQVVVLPADQAFRDERSFVSTVQGAAAMNRDAPDHVLMLGFEPDDVGSRRDWIVPAFAPTGGPAPVARFVDAATPEEAQRLIEGGALWSPSVLIGMARTFFALFEDLVPALTCAASRRVDHPKTRFVPADAGLPERDFSADVLTRASSHLRVVTAPSCGWSDVAGPTPYRERPQALLPTRNPRASESLPALRALV